MQFLPVIQDSNEQLSKVHTYVSPRTMDNTRDIYSWPSGWKDMRKASGLPAVVDDKTDQKALKSEDQFDNGFPVLPVISPDAEGDATKKRKILKRQSKIYFGIGSMLPPLQEARLKLAQDIQALAERTLSTKTEPPVLKVTKDEKSDPDNEQNEITGGNSLFIADKSPDACKQRSENQRLGGYAVFHNGIYFVVPRSQSPTPSLDKHELRLSPKSERKAQEDYIQQQLTNSQLMTQDNNRSLLQRRDSSTPSKGKKVTFSPDIGRESEEESKKESQPVRSKMSNSSYKLSLPEETLTYDSDSEYSNSEGQNTHGSLHKTRFPKEACTDINRRLTVSRDKNRDYSPSGTSSRDSSVQGASHRKRSPWRIRFQDRLDQINRRISENVQVSKGTKNTHGSRSPNITLHRGGRNEGAKQKLRENLHSESLINNNELHEKGKPRPVGNENLVLGDQANTAGNFLDLRGASIHVDGTRPNGTRRGNRSVVLTPRNNGGGQKPSFRVAATATKRRDYVFQFSKTESRLSTGARIPRGGSLEEWSVEYIGVDKRPQNANSQDKPRTLLQTNTRQQNLVTLDETKLVQTDNPLSMSSTFTLQREVVSGHRGKSNVGNEFLTPGQSGESDMPILVKVDSSRGYANTEISTLPMIGAKSGEQEHNKKEFDKEKNRLYVGSTVPTQGKRKHSRKGESLRRRFNKKKLLSTKTGSNKDKQKKGTMPKVEESVDMTSSIDRSMAAIPEVPVLTFENDTETVGSSSGVGRQSMDIRDTPSSLPSCLQVKHPNTARSSVLNGGDTSYMEVEEEDEDVLGDLIQVSQVNFSEKDKLKRQSRPVLLKSERKIQRSPRHRLPKSNSQPPLPPIGSKLGDDLRYGESMSRLGENGDRLEEEPKSRQDMRTGRMKPWMKPAPQNFSLPRLQADVSMAMTSSLAMQAREDISRVVSEIEKMRWNQEQHEERVLTYGVKNFISPRVVLVSSRMPRCHSMKKAIRKDKNVIFIVYDFDTWSFDDILSAIRSRLDKYNKECKMHSVLFLCGGGIGFCYLLKNFVMTPQKLQRTDYAAVLEFWGKIGNMISKLNPDEATINIMGSSLDADKQGKEVLSVVRKAVHPNIVRVESPSEHLAEGRKTLNQYFVYRRFLLWRTVNDDIVSKLGHGDLDRDRSWSELAEDAESDS